MWRLSAILIGLMVFVGVSVRVISAESAHAGGTIRYVAIDGDNGNPCTAAQPCASIGRAERLSAEGDTIYVRPGSYDQSIGFESVHPDTYTVAAVDATDTVCSGGTVCADVRRVSVQANESIAVSGFSFSGAASSSIISVASGSSAGNLTLTSCRIEDHRRTFPSDPFSATPIANLGTLLIEDCYFGNNDGEFGGVLSNRNRAVIFNTTFEGNDAAEGGAIFSPSSDDLIVTDSTLRNNAATGDGGAIWGEFTLTNVTLEGNSAGNDGGALASGLNGASTTTYTVRDSTVISNTAMGNGGALHIDNTAGTVSIDGTTFADNEAVASSGSSSEGGAAWLKVNGFAIQNSTFRANTSAGDGGALWMFLASGAIAGPSSISNTLFDHNSANDVSRGGAIHYDSGGGVSVVLPMTIDTVTFSNNRAADSGGAVLIEKQTSRVTFRNSNFINNSTFLLGATGGGLHVDAGTHSLIDSAFVNNSANGCGALDNGGTVTLVDTSFVGNSISSGSSGRGGAICNESDLTMFGGRIGMNTGVFGGGLYNNNDALLTGVTIDDNEVVEELGVGDGLGGGIHNDVDGTLTLANSTVSGNSAENHGGGIYNLGIAAFNFTTITNNSADSSNSNAGNGGGVYIADGTFTLANSILAGNIDPFQGGGGLGDLTFSPNCGSAFGPTSVPITSDGYNIIGSAFCGVTGDTTGNQLGTTSSQLDAQLGLLGSNGGSTQTHLPASTSPAIDNVTDTSRCSGLFVSLDQRGFSRPAGFGCDSGSVEVDGVPTAVTMRSHQVRTLRTPPVTTSLVGALLMLTGCAYFGRNRSNRTTSQ